MEYDINLQRPGDGVAPLRLAELAMAFLIANATNRDILPAERPGYVHAVINISQKIRNYTR